MIGIDIVENNRIEKLIQKYEKDFINKIADKPEAEYLIDNRNMNIETVAGYFAAKEAIAKATGLGLSSMGLKEIKIKYSNGGQPYGQWKEQVFYLSISHESEYTVAVARIKEDNLTLEIPNTLFEAFPRPKSTDHKGSRGRVGIIGSSPGMLGSGILSSRAALRIGAGLVYHIAKPEILDVLSLRHLEIMVKSYNNLKDEVEFTKSLDTLAIGPGMGLSSLDYQRFLHHMDFPGNLVIDADGLTHLSKDLTVISSRKPFTTVLTPHHMEMQRLTGIPVDEIRHNPLDIANAFAKEHKVVLLLKGMNTVVTNGIDDYINSTGSPSLATAGTGDVLTGIISGLLAQGVEPYTGACLGAFIHGACGNFLEDMMTSNATIASDLIKILPKVLKYFYI